MLKEVAEEMGRGDTFHKADVGVYFGEPGKTVPDPFFGGEGPGAHRLHPVRRLHGRLPRTARRTRSTRTTSSSPRRRAPSIQSRVARRRRDAARGRRLRAHDRDARRACFTPRRTLRARGVVVSGGSYGTVNLLMRCKESGSLGEALRAARALPAHEQRGAPRRAVEQEGRRLLEGHRDHERRLRRRQDAHRGRALPRGLRRAGAARDGAHGRRRHDPALAALDGHGRSAIRCSSSARVIPFGWAKKTAILLVMQPVDNHLALPAAAPLVLAVLEEARQRTAATGEPAPTYIPIANLVAKKMAEEDGRHAAERAPRGAPRQGLDGSHPRRLPDRPDAGGRRRVLGALHGEPHRPRPLGGDRPAPLRILR